MHLKKNMQHSSFMDPGFAKKNPQDWCYLQQTMGIWNQVLFWQNFGICSW